MANENFLDITELDFEGIKQNFKEYLKSKQKFNGYDFEGSSMNILFDILAYNTHYNAFYASMVGNEMFIDSASKRDSVVSHAKLLNYIPRSTTSARATVNLRRTTSATINRGSFVTGTYINENNQAQSKVFTFLEDYEYSQFGVNDWRINGAVLHEGTLQTLTYVFDTRLREKKFLLPSNADIRSIRVKIRQSASAAEDDTETWYRATDFSMIGENEKIFFVQAAYDGQYEVYFGDGVLGKPLYNGNIIYIEYLQSTGEEGNFFSSFSLASTTIETVSPASGGSSPEDITDIRKNAPKAFAAQNRSVTASDYESVILSVYPQAETVKVWGGEDNDPPQFGKVFVSIKPNGGMVISNTDKDTILASLKGKAVVGIVPEVVDPEYIYAILTVTTNFNPAKTSLSRNEISGLQRAAILDYFDNVLEKFDTPLYTSKLNKVLDEVDSAILGTNIETLIEQRIRPNIRYAAFINLKFYNRVFHPYEGHKGAIRSSLFGYRNTVGETKPSYIEDDGYGKLHIVTGEAGLKKVVLKDAGEIDYNTGNITLFEFKPVDFGNLDHIKIRIQPTTNDIFAMKNKIITIDAGSISLNTYSKEEAERIIRTGSQDFTDSLGARGLLPEGPVIVSGGEAIRSPSPFVTPVLPPLPPLPNSVPIVVPAFGRLT
jgi:hypothetical protein